LSGCGSLILPEFFCLHQTVCPSDRALMPQLSKPAPCSQASSSKEKTCQPGNKERAPASPTREIFSDAGERDDNRGLPEPSSCPDEVESSSWIISLDGNSYDIVKRASNLTDFDQNCLLACLPVSANTARLHIIKFLTCL